MDVLERAGLTPRDLLPDPAAPFKVKPASAQAKTKLERVRHVLAPLGPDQRWPLLWAVFGAMDAGAWEAFVDATMAARRASGATWNEEPWKAWAGLIEDEHARRAYVPTAADLDGETDRRATERTKLLALLRVAGPRGVLNTAIEAGEIGRRYSARLGELREAGYVVDTIRVSQRVFRFVLRSEPQMKQARLESVA